MKFLCCSQAFPLEKVEDKEVIAMIVSVLSFFLAWGESSSICVKKLLCSLLSARKERREEGSYQQRPLRYGLPEI